MIKSVFRLLGLLVVLVSHLPAFRTHSCSCDFWTHCPPAAPSFAELPLAGSHFVKSEDSQSSRGRFPVNPWRSTFCLSSVFHHPPSSEGGWWSPPSHPRAARRKVVSWDCTPALSEMPPNVHLHFLFHWQCCLTHFGDEGTTSQGRGLSHQGERGTTLRQTKP